MGVEREKGRLQRVDSDCGGSGFHIAHRSNESTRHHRLCVAHCGIGHTNSHMIYFYGNIREVTESVEVELG